MAMEFSCKCRAPRSLLCNANMGHLGFSYKDHCFMYQLFSVCSQVYPRPSANSISLALFTNPLNQIGENGV